MYGVQSRTPSLASFTRSRTSASRSQACESASASRPARPCFVHAPSRRFQYRVVPAPGARRPPWRANECRLRVRADGRQSAPLRVREGAVRSRLSSDRRHYRRVDPLASPPQRARHHGDRHAGAPSFSWGVFGAFALSCAVPAGPRIRAIYGNWIPRDPHHGHIGRLGESEAGVGVAEEVGRGIAAGRWLVAAAAKMLAGRLERSDLTALRCQFL